MLGLDGDTEEIFDLIPRFVEETGLYDVQVTVMTPFPGTPLYRQLAAAGRLIEPRNWRKCTLFDVNFRPLNMSPERLEQKFRELAAELYSTEALKARHRRFKEKLRPPPASGSTGNPTPQKKGRISRAESGG